MIFLILGMLWDRNLTRNMQKAVVRRSQGLKKWTWVKHKAGERSREKGGQRVSKGQSLEAERAG